MSNGIIKIKEEYIKEAENKADGLIQRVYPAFQQEFAGSLGFSTIGIEKYRSILKNELKAIISMQLSLDDIEKGDEDKDSFSQKYNRLVDDEEKTTEEVHINYSLLAGYGVAVLETSAELKTIKNLKLMQDMEDVIGEVKITLSTGATSLVEKDKVYIPKVVSFLKERGLLKNSTDIDLAILFAKAKVSEVRFNLQKEELEKLEKKSLERIKNLKIQLNGYVITNCEVEDADTQQRAGAKQAKFDVEEVEWDDVIGQEEAKLALRDMVVRYLATYDYTTGKSIFENVLGTKPPKALLMFGPPGTGKTFSLKAAITEAERIRQTLIKTGKLNPDMKAENKRIYWNIITPDVIKNKYIGESAKAIKSIFDAAKKEAPGLLVIDELDALSTKRGEDGFNEGEREIMSVLMQELDGIQKSTGYILIGITNVPKCLDKALLSRFDNKIRFTNPKNAEEVSALLKVHMTNLTKIGGIDIDKQGYKEIGEEGLKLGYNGRLVKQFVETLERERNIILTDLYKDNKEIIKEYYTDFNKMKEKLNKKCKQFTVGYIKQRMKKFAEDNTNAGNYFIE